MVRFGPDVTASVRRLRTRGLDPFVLASAAIVALMLLGALLTFSHPGTGRAEGPRNVSFSAALRGCPAVGSDTAIRVGSLGTGTGAIFTRQGAAPATRSGVVQPTRTTDVPGNGQPRTVTVTGPAAAGLVVGSFGSKPLAGTRCTEPTSDYWFSGLGAASTHDSIVEIDNPADTQAEVVITTYSSRPSVAPISDDRVLSARSSLSIDMFRDTPQYGVFAIHAAVVRGQATVSVRDQVQTPGQPALGEWLIPQATPANSVSLLGMPSGSRQTLTVANPGTDQVTATVRLITKTSIFTPAKLPGLDVAGGCVATVDLSKVLAGGGDVLGVEVDAPSPITASVSSVVNGDLAFTGVDPLLTAEGGAVLPDGNKSLIIGAASTAGSVTVIARDASGAIVAKRSVRLTTAGAAAVALPSTAVLVQIQTNKIHLNAAVVVTGDGAVVVPVGRVIRVSSVPYVRPGVG